MILKRVVSIAIISTFLFTQNVWCMSPSHEEDESTLSYGIRKNIDDKNSPEEGVSSGGITLEEEIRQVRTIQHTTLKFTDINKLLFGLAFFPLVEAEDSYTTTAVSYVKPILPVAGTALILSGLMAAPKICSYLGLDRLRQYVGSTFVMRWPSEFLRGGYFMLGGKRSIGDIPLVSGVQRSGYCAGFYELLTAQPYAVELRHAVRLKDFRPYFVKTILFFDEKLPKEGWAKEEIWDRIMNRFRGFSYQKPGVAFHIRGGMRSEKFPGMYSAGGASLSHPIEPENRFKEWKAFFKPLKDNGINLLSNEVHEALQGLVLENGYEEGKDATEMFIENDGKTLFLFYKKSLLIGLQNNYSPLPKLKRAIGEASEGESKSDGEKMGFRRKLIRRKSSKNLSPDNDREKAREEESKSDGEGKKLRHRLVARVTSSKNLSPNNGK